MDGVKDRDTLLKEYLAINVNSATQLEALQKDAENYLESLGGKIVYLDDIEVTHLVRIVKALKHYLLTDDIEASYEIVYPVLNSAGIDILEHYDYQLTLPWMFRVASLTDSITVCKDLDKALKLANGLEKLLASYKEKDPKNHANLIVGIYTNISLILLYSKYFSEEWDEKYTAEFDKYVNLAMEIAFKYEMYTQSEINKLRKYIFYKNEAGINTCLEIIKIYEGEEVYKATKLAIDKYIKI